MPRFHVYFSTQRSRGEQSYLGDTFKNEKRGSWTSISWLFIETVADFLSSFDLYIAQVLSLDSLQFENLYSIIFHNLITFAKLYTSKDRTRTNALPHRVQLR